MKTTRERRTTTPDAGAATHGETTMHDTGTTTRGRGMPARFAASWRRVRALLVKEMRQLLRDPRTQRIIFVDQGSQERRVALLQNNEVDGLPQINAGPFQTAQARNKAVVGWSKDQPWAWVDPCPTRFVFNCQKAPWDNPELRNAISMAIDRDFLAEKVWQNSMLPGYSMVPPGIEGYTSDMASFAEESQIDREDKAKAVLEKLGYGPDKPLKMEIRYNTSENHKNTAVAIQEQLKPLGVEVTLLNTDTKTHYGHLEQKGDFDVARAGWIAAIRIRWTSIAW